MSPEEQADLRARWARENHPGEVERRAQLASALEHVQRGGGDLLLSYTHSLYAPAIVERGEAAQRRAAQAGQAASSAAVH